jgi:ABC-type dipeptide/oligopeptide/nickel transport system permease subunit
VIGVLARSKFFLQRFRRQSGAVLGLILVFALLSFACLGPLLAGRDPYESHFDIGIDGLGNPVGPGTTFFLGTDRIFRDQFVRLAIGARTSLFVGLAATAIATVLGGLLGILGGFYEGREGLRLPWPSLVLVPLGLVTGQAWLIGVTLALVLAWNLPQTKHLRRHRYAAVLAADVSITADSVLGLAIDVGMSFPFLLLVLAIGAAFENASKTSILITLGCTGWMGIARVVRAKTLEVRSRDFVTASIGLGQHTPKLLWHHIFPNVRGPLFALATLSVGPMIVAESVLSYLGVGLSPPAPTWGHMLLDGQEVLGQAPWLFFAPAVLIVGSALGFNLLGEGIRHAYAQDR